MRFAKRDMAGSPVPRFKEGITGAEVMNEGQNTQTGDNLYKKGAALKWMGIYQITQVYGFAKLLLPNIASKIPLSVGHNVFLSFRLPTYAVGRGSPSSLVSAHIVL